MQIVVMIRDDDGAEVAASVVSGVPDDLSDVWGGLWDRAHTAVHRQFDAAYEEFCQKKGIV